MHHDLPFLEINSLTCERDDRILFGDLDWRAFPGEIWQVAGPNGAGKTTLLRIIAGLHGHFDGQRLWPRACQQNVDPRQHLLYIGHRPGLRGELTPLENLAWWLALHGVKGLDPRPPLAQLGLAGYETVPVAQLSAGQQRRVALSLLWLLDKPVWLLDEPFTALDADGVALIEQRLRAHAENGGLVIYSSHHRLDANVRHVRLGQGRGDVA